MRDLVNVFNYQTKEVRTVIKDGEPWFVAKDVCEILEISNNRDAVSRLSEHMTGVVTTDTSIGSRDMTVINEPGVYKLVFTSRRPEAEKFIDWIATEVLPSIRKHGMYATENTIEKMLEDPDTMIQLLTKLKLERKAKILEQAKVNTLEERVVKDKPKVIFADAVSVSSSSILIRDLAKLIQQNGVKMGGNRLFTWLRDNGYLIKAMSTSYNMPTQRSMDLKLFEIKETAITHSDGHIHVNKTSKVTGKGQVYFINKFIKTI